MRGLGQIQSHVISRELLIVAVEAEQSQRSFQSDTGLLLNLACSGTCRHFPPFDTTTREQSTRRIRMTNQENVAIGVSDKDASAKGPPSCNPELGLQNCLGQNAI